MKNTKKHKSKHHLADILFAIGTCILCVIIGVGGVYLTIKLDHLSKQPSPEPPTVIVAHPERKLLPEIETVIETTPAPVVDDGLVDFHHTGDEYYKHYNMLGLTPVAAQTDVMKLVQQIKTDMNHSGMISKVNISDEDLALLLQVTEAEVTGAFDPSIEGKLKTTATEGYTAKVNVVDVIINRVNDPRFPNNVRDVILQKNAFSPIIDGRYEIVDIQSITACAVRDALDSCSADLTCGALFFQAGSKENPYGRYLFTDGVGHSFFTYE